MQLMIRLQMQDVNVLPLCLFLSVSFSFSVPFSVPSSPPFFSSLFPYRPLFNSSSATSRENEDPGEENQET